MDFSKLRQGFPLSEKSSVEKPSKNPVDDSVDKPVETETKNEDIHKLSTDEYTELPVENESMDDLNIIDNDHEIFSGSIKKDLPDFPQPSTLSLNQMKRVRDFKKEKAKKSKTNRDPNKESKKYEHRKRVNPSVEKPAPIVEKYSPKKKQYSGSLVHDGPTPREKWNNQTPGKRKYRYYRDTGRVNPQERAFFERLGTSIRQYENGDFDMSFLNPPLNWRETDRERSERIKNITKATEGIDFYKRGSHKKFNKKHREMIEFLAHFKYAKASHLSSMFAESNNTTYKRLLDMREYGLVIDRPILDQEPLWFLTKAGMALSGYDYQHVTNAKLGVMLMPHRFLVNHLAANLWNNNVNVLDLKDYPAKNKTDETGRAVYGETLVSEDDILSSLSKMRNGTKEVYAPLIKNNVERAFDQWQKAGGVSFGPSPEFTFGNEYMWAFRPAKVVDLSYHVPDLVVARKRSADGSPNSIAVEAERATKKEVSTYRKTLEAFRLDDTIYKQLIWVVHKKATANRLLKAEEGLGLLKSGRMKIIPIITKDGIFTRPDMEAL